VALSKLLSCARMIRAKGFERKLMRSTGYGAHRNQVREDVTPVNVHPLGNRPDRVRWIRRLDTPHEACPVLLHGRLLWRDYRLSAAARRRSSSPGTGASTWWWAGRKPDR